MMMDGATFYELVISGNTKAGTSKDFQPRGQYISVADNKILLLDSDGTTVKTLFDAQTGYWPGSGFFDDFPLVLFTASLSTISNDYINQEAYEVAFDTGSSNCEYYPDYGTICGGDYDETLREREYYIANVGPVGYYGYTGISDPDWSFSSTTNIGLIASSLRGDTVDYDLETEPNDSPDTAQSVTLPSIVEGYVFGDEGTLVTINEIKEVEPNECPSFAQVLEMPAVPAVLTGDASENDHGCYFQFNPYGTVLTVNSQDWYRFTLDSYTNIAFRLDFQGPDVDLDLFLFDGSSSLIVYSIKDNPLLNSYYENLERNLAPGTYFIVVDAFATPDGRVDYTLDSHIIGDKENTQEVEDWYTFTVDSQSTITITLDFEGSTDTDFDLYLLNGGSDTVLASSRNDNVTSGVRIETITTTLNPGTYFVGVDAYNWHSGDYTLTIQ